MSTKTGILEKIFRKENKSAQETIPYKEMLPNGICALENGEFNITIEFDDISYQLAEVEEKKAMFHSYCDFINFFSHEMSVEFSFLNQKVNETIIDKQIQIELKGDNLDIYREEYQKYLKAQQRKGNNGLIKRKFVTVGVKASDYNEAKNRLERIERQVIENFKRLGCKATKLNGKSRLNLLFRCMNRNRKFNFTTWEKLKESRRTTKDLIVPSAFDFQLSTKFKMGRQVCTSSCVDIMTEELDDGFLSSLLELNQGMLVSLHIHSFSQKEAQKMIRVKLSDLQARAIDYQKSARDKGQNAPLPPELSAQIESLEELLRKVTEQNQRLFNVVMVITNISDNPEENYLEFKATEDVVQSANNRLQPLIWEQESGLISSLPLGIQCLIKKERTLSTNSLAILMPFITKNLFQIDKSAVYYGLNSLNNNMIMASRKRLKTPNGIILGKPGGGKSFTAKREFVNLLLIGDDDVLIVDPEGEYKDITNALGGTVVTISPVSDSYINPLDLTLTDDVDDDAIVMKTDFILSFCELVMRRTLTAGERTIVGRCIEVIYQPYLENPSQDTIPILEDLYNALLLVNDSEDNGKSKEIALDIALGLEFYVKGQMKIFNHRTNVDLRNRLVNFDIKEIGEGLRPIGMLIVQELVWQKVKQNKELGKFTWYYVDEYHLLLRHEQTAKYSVEIYKRFRKWGGSPTGMTQNVKDFLSSYEVQNILENCDFIIMLNQAPDDLRILQKRLNISNELAEKAINAEAGHGVLIYDDIQLSFADKFPKNTLLYKVMTTNPQELAKYRKEKEENPDMNFEIDIFEEDTIADKNDEEIDRLTS